MSEDDNDGSGILLGLGLIVGGALVARAICKKISSKGNTQETSNLTDRVESTSKPARVEEPIQQSHEEESEEKIYHCINPGCNKYYKLSEGYGQYCSYECDNEDN